MMYMLFPKRRAGSYPMFFNYFRCIPLYADLARSLRNPTGHLITCYTLDDQKAVYHFAVCIMV